MGGSFLCCPLDCTILHRTASAGKGEESYSGTFGDSTSATVTSITSPLTVISLVGVALDRGSEYNEDRSPQSSPTGMLNANGPFHRAQEHLVSVHNMMIGPPGADLISEGTPLIRHRPFRAPHHTISHAGLVGGGRWPRPGEVSLAHRGVLFLDELPEFGPRNLETLCQPMEGKIVTISRASGALTFPASFQLIAAMDPCPCGYYGDPEREVQANCVRWLAGHGAQLRNVGATGSASPAR
jgi:hypothetical protein